MLQHWRANVDLQVIVDVQACARYMVKYAAKGEPRSQSVQSLYRSCVAHLNDSSNARKALRSAIVCSVVERDFSAQETSHMLLSLPLFSCTYNFVTVALNASRKLTREEDSGELVLEDSALDKYASRDSSLGDLNLCQFVSSYYTVCGEVLKRSAPVIVRTFPSFSSNPRSELYDQYCKYQLIKYRPWVGIPSNAWLRGDEPCQDFVAVYRDFLQTDKARQYVPNFGEELDLAQQYIAENDGDDEEDMLLSSEQDDWMLCCRLNQHYAMGTASRTDSFDWAAFTRYLSPDLIRECPSWIRLSRAACSENPNSPWHRQLPTLKYPALLLNKILHIPSLWSTIAK